MPRFVVNLVFVLAFAAAGGVRAAEPEPPEGELVLPPVEVRAPRSFPAATDDPTAAAGAIPRDELARPGVDVPDVLETQPGLRVTRLGGVGSHATVSIRGSTPDQVRVYLDGVLLNPPEGGGVDLSSLPVGPIERIEVYRGAAPAAYGGTAMGGVVHVRTRPADTRRLELALGAGSFWTRSARGFYTEPWEAVELTLALDYEGTRGDFTFENDNGTAFTSDDDRTVTRENNASDAVAALAKVRLRLGERVSLTVQDSLWWRDAGLPGIALYETRASGLTELRNLASLVVEGRGTGLLAPEWDARASLAFQRQQLHDPEAEVGLGRRASDDRSLSPRLGGALRWPLAEWVTPSASVDYRYEDFAPSADGAVSAAGSVRHVVEAGVAVELRVEPLRTTIVPSGALEVAASRLAAPDPLGAERGASREATDIDGGFRVGLVNDAVPYTLLKANGGRAVRLPSLFELFGDTGYVRGNPTLRPESSWFVDAGVVHQARWLPSPNRMEIELFGFFSDVDDLIQFVQTSQNVSVARNVAAARLFGVELGLRGDFLGHVRLSGAVTWLLSEDVSGLRAQDGNELPYRPRDRWFVRVEGYLGFGAAVPEGGLYVEGEGMAGNFLDPANLVEVPRRTTLAVGAYVWLFDRRLRVELVGRNLTDSRVLDLAGFPLPGRSVYASLLGRVF